MPAKKTEKKEDKKKAVVKKAKVTNVTKTDFGDMVIEQTDFPDGSSIAKIV